MAITSKVYFLVKTAADAWCDPPVSHIDHDGKPWVRHVVRWAGNVALG